MGIRYPTFSVLSDLSNLTMMLTVKHWKRFIPLELSVFSINLVVVYRESENLIGYITRRLSADSQQL